MQFQNSGLFKQYFSSNESGKCLVHQGICGIVLVADGPAAGEQKRHIYR